MSTNWRRIAAILAARVAEYQVCVAHPANAPGKDCPFCADRAAYKVWLDAGGYDYRNGEPTAEPALAVEVRQLRHTKPRG